MTSKKLASFILLAGASALLAACSTSGENAGPAAAPTETFAISSVSIAPMTTANLCSALGGQGARPQITIAHTAAAGVPIRIRMYDSLSDGSTFDHRRTRVTSDGSGTTTVSHAFLPPCNTTGGRLDSTYRFDVEAAGSSKTVTWGRFDSGTRRIN